VLGYAIGQTKDIKPLYEAADVIVTPHTIATRVIREGLAMAKPVINKNGLRAWWELFQKDPEGLRQRARKTAEKHYGIRQAGEAMLKIAKKVLQRKSQRRKVLIDLGGHLGETVRRFYKEVPDARFYEIFTLEPHPACFEKMKQVLERMKNVEFIPRAIGQPGNNRFTRLYPGDVNNGDGSTLLRGKTTGGINYAKPITVRIQTLQNFMKEYEIHPSDYVVLKMNIEGGEYEIMREILEKHMMIFFEQIYIQTHKFKLQITGKELDEYGCLEKKFTAEAAKNNVQLFMQEKGMARFQCEEVPG